MGDGGDLRISKESAAEINKGLSGAIGELKELGGFGSATESLQGAGFSALSMSPLEAGDGSLCDVFEDFCDRWEWGVRGLIGDANALAEKLGLAAGMEHEEDAYWQGTWKTGLNSLTGNPYADEKDLAKQSYGDILKPDGPETAGQLMQESQAMRQDWKDTAHEVTQSGIGGAGYGEFRKAAGLPPEPGAEPAGPAEPQPGGEN